MSSEQDEITPLETLFDDGSGVVLPLPPALAALYGTLRLPRNGARATVIGNFVTTLDGVVALEQGGGGPISGYNKSDRMVMGILRAAADAVIVGAGTLRDSSKALWTAEAVVPALADAYGALRQALGKGGAPLNVIVTGSGELDPASRLFQQRDAPVLLITTAAGQKRLRECGIPAHVAIAVGAAEGRIRAAEIVALTAAHSRGDTLLLEGGPHLMNDFIAERCVDALFLTIAPQIAGRGADDERPGLVTGQRFAPDDGRWGRLADVKRADDHLFLQYHFAPPAP